VLPEGKKARALKASEVSTNAPLADSADEPVHFGYAVKAL
jgi:hypothetical protein